MKIKYHSFTFTGRHTFFILMMMLSPILNAARVVDGSLGHWIADEASPRLAEKLSNHPRFKGEKIKIMAMKNGYPTRVTDALTEQIREQLRDDLLTLADARIVFDDENRCQTINVNTVLGIEVEVHNSRSFRVSLAFVDINEGVWLSGTNLSWLGRVSNSQQKAFNAPLARFEPTSVFMPSEFTEMATALHRQLKCNDFIATPIFFAPPENEFERGVLRKLREKIANRNLVTLDKSVASSFITLKSPAGASGSLFLELRDSVTPEQVVRIAEVSIANQHPLHSQDPVSHHTPNIISAIQIDEGRSTRNVCRNQKKGCIPVSFNLTRSAFTLLFYTVNGEVLNLSCKTPQRQKMGEYNFGLNVPTEDSNPIPGLGFYALAVTDKRAAQSLYQLLKTNASGCGQRISPNDRWMASLENLLKQYDTSVDWQAIHLTREGSQITRI
jgi:hypothetical protein